MSIKVGLSYWIPKLSTDERDVTITYFPFGKHQSLTDDDLEKIIQFTDSIKTGWKNTQSKYPAVEVKVSPAFEGINPLCTAAYHIELTGEKESVAEATAFFMECAGTPNLVYRKYSIVKPILQQYGKKLKRCLGIGRYVVDM